MTDTPEIETRTEQPYVAIRARVSMDGIAAFAVRTGEVFGWLGARGLAPAGPPFLKFNVIDMARELEIENGVPVAAPVNGDDLVVAGVLPAGRYATVTHTGHPSELVEVTGALLDWGAEKGLTWDVSPAARALSALSRAACAALRAVSMSVSIAEPGLTRPAL